MRKTISKMIFVFYICIVLRYDDWFVKLKPFFASSSFSASSLLSSIFILWHLSVCPSRTFGQQFGFFLFSDSWMVCTWSNSVFTLKTQLAHIHNHTHKHTRTHNDACVQKFSRSPALHECAYDVFISQHMNRKKFISKIKQKTWRKWNERISLYI